jgi:hypothetical protein
VKSGDNLHHLAALSGSSHSSPPVFPIPPTTSRFISDAARNLSATLQSRSTLLGRADRCIGEFRVRLTSGLAASVEPEGAGQEKDSNLLKV